MKEYAYYPGCSMGTTAATYRLSTAYVAERIGLKLHEIPDWSCCGATAAHCRGETLAYALAARNLALAEQAFPGLDVATPCAACYSRLQYAASAAKTDETVRQKLETVLHMPYKATAAVKNFLEVFSDPAVMEACRAGTCRSLAGLKVACYYGCLMSRPRGVTGASEVEAPKAMDEIVALSGMTCVDWDFKTECCGASHQVDAPEAARPLIVKILQNAADCGAEAIVTACPLCALNLDMRQKEATAGTLSLPIYQFTELLAFGMGAGAKEMGLEKHFTPAFALINRHLKKAGETA